MSKDATSSVMKHNPLAGLSSGGGMNSYLRDTREDTEATEKEMVVEKPVVVEAPKAETVVLVPIVKEDIATKNKGVAEGYQRYSFVVKDSYIEQIRRKAFWERRKIMDLLNEAVGKYLEGGKVYKAIPKEFDK